MIDALLDNGAVRIRTLTLLAALCGASLLSGCGASAPPRKDPLAGIVAAAYPDTTLGLIISESTKANIDFLSKNTHMKMLNRSRGLKPERFRDAAIAALKKNFKSVVVIEQPSDARGVSADVVAVLDVYVAVTHRFQFWLMNTNIDMKADVSALFTDLAGKQVAEAKAATPVRPFANGFVGNPEFLTLDAELAESFQREVRAQSSLAAFRASPAPAARMIYSSDVDRPGYSAPENPNGFALVIGIEEYESLPKADFAERDAHSVREHLRGLGYPERNILFLSGRKAGKAAIEKYVESWLPMNVKEDSKVVVFFSGHGAPDVKTGYAYLVPWDGDAKFIENTGYPVKKLYEKLNALKAREVIVALDACFSGTGGRSVLAKGIRPLVAKVDVGMDAASRLVILSASSADEVTGTDESQGHGLFTYHLLKGLNDSKGRSSVRQLYDYLLPKVQDSARLDNRDQTPQVYPADLKNEARLGLK